MLSCMSFVFTLSRHGFAWRGPLNVHATRPSSPQISPKPPLENAALAAQATRCMRFFPSNGPLVNATSDRRHFRPACRFSLTTHGTMRFYRKRLDVIKYQRAEVQSDFRNTRGDFRNSWGVVFPRKNAWPCKATHQVRSYRKRLVFIKYQRAKLQRTFRNMFRNNFGIPRI